MNKEFNADITIAMKCSATMIYFKIRFQKTIRQKK